MKEVSGLRYLAQIWDVDIIIRTIGSTPSIFVADDGRRRVTQVVIN